MMQSYVVPCSTAFRDTVLEAAQAHGATASGLARSILLIMDGEALTRFPDPGDAPPDDREAITLKSGRTAGRVLRRKPRLQLRLPDGLDSATIRRALTAALSLMGWEIGHWRGDPAAEEAAADPVPAGSATPAQAAAQRDTAVGPDPESVPAAMDGPPAASLVAALKAENSQLRTRLEALTGPDGQPGGLPSTGDDGAAEIARLSAQVTDLQQRLADAEHAAAEQARAELAEARRENERLAAEVAHLRSELDKSTAAAKAQEEVDHLRAVVSTLAFDVLPDGVRDEREAMYVLGFPPRSRPTTDMVKHKFRLLSHIYHPDKILGDDRRMGQLLDAARLLQSRR